MFIESARPRLVGRTVGPIRWLRPILSVAVGGRKEGLYLTFILESPGPFCFLSPEDPLEGVEAPARFANMTGTTISGLARTPGERICRIDAAANKETGGALVLKALLFGSAGRVELSRPDGSKSQHVGSKIRPAPGVRAEDAVDLPQGPIYLLSTGRIGRVGPSDQDDPEAAHRFGPFEDPVTACERVGSLILAEVHDRMVAHRVRPFERRIAARRKLMSKLRAELEDAGDHETLRREAETLAAYQTSVKPGAGSVELPDVYAPDHRIRIELDPALPVQVQIEKRFKKAAKLARSLDHTRKRIAQVEREVEELQDAVAAAGEAGGFAAAMAELDRLDRAHGQARSGAGSNSTRTAPAGAAAPASPFRRFDLNDMWFVLVGRNNRENDKLTFHTAAPGDLWFHAQQVAGSHVVLKCRGNPGSPPPHILEATAAIAAYFSKSKHSGLAPVVYTQRKYVRKFRGAKPGQVVCEREKTIMVAPGLPPRKTSPN
jgi:hypothetical protein